MIATAALAAAVILGSHATSAAGHSRQTLMFRSYGEVVVRLDATGDVEARACGGRLRHVGDIAARPVKVHISNDGDLAGFTWDPTLTPAQQTAFRQMMRAVGYSDWSALERACLPAAGAPASPHAPDEPTLGWRPAAP